MATSEWRMGDGKRRVTGKGISGEREKY